MRTNAENVAASATVGGDDMLSKWQLMAEQARQKREGTDTSSGSQPAKDVSRKSSVSGKSTKDNHEGDKKVLLILQLQQGIELFFWGRVPLALNAGAGV
ncbi:hypothetical protein HN51_069784 [Arachis hypogaea]